MSRDGLHGINQLALWQEIVAALVQRHGDCEIPLSDMVPRDKRVIASIRGDRVVLRLASLADAEHIWKQSQRDQGRRN